MVAVEAAASRRRASCWSPLLAGLLMALVLHVQPTQAWLPLGTLPTLGTARTRLPPVVICPGFGNDAVDYLNPLELGKEESFAAALRRRGFDVFVVPVKRTDWLKFGSGLFTADFWSQKMTARNPSFNWYLGKVEGTVEEAVAASGGDRALIVGHSAGGWLARAALGDGEWAGSAAAEACELVQGCVTLGTPHLPPAPPGVDMTRGALTHVHENYPGAFLKGRGISYTTVAGVAVQGQADAEQRSLPRFAYGSYRQVCGRGDVVGDGVVPLESAHLDGAKQINLKGIYHSINAPTAWYGSEGVVDSWLRKVEGLKY